MNNSPAPSQASTPKNGALNGTAPQSAAVNLISDSSDDNDDDDDAADNESMMTTDKPSSVSAAVDITEDGRSQSPCPETAPPLPTTLDAELLVAINLIKSAASQSSEGKQKFFDNRVNGLLLQ